MKIQEAIEQFLLDCRVNGRTKPTIDTYRQRLGVLAHLLETVCTNSTGDTMCITELEQVTVNYLRQCVQHMLDEKVVYQRGRRTEGETLSPNTVRTSVRAFKAFFNWCYQEDLISQNPVKRLKSPKVPTRIVPTFTAEHIEKMLAACDTSTSTGFRNYVMLLLLLDTGMRIGEICTLKVSDVRTDHVKVFGKGRKEREIGIVPEVSKLLWKYIHKYRKPANPDETALFIGRGKPLRLFGVHDVIKRIQERSGLTDIKFTAHVFRHTFAKMYLERGGDLFKLSRELGHTDVQVTKIYLGNFSSIEARREHTSYSPVSGINLKKQSTRKKKQK